MSSQPLFLDRLVEFEKDAGMLSKLSDNYDIWPQEIMQEAYKQLPYLSNFEVSVSVDKMDEGRGYAFGSLSVRAHSDKPEEQRSSFDSVHIPFVVKNQMMSPLDLFIYGKKYNYLTEARLRSVLFNPSTFDSLHDRPRESTLGVSLRPPNGGLGGVKVAMMPMVPATPSSAVLPASPTAATPPVPTNPVGAVAPTKTASVLGRLKGQVRQDHVDRLKTAMADPSIRMSWANADPGAKIAMAEALSLRPADPEKTAAAVRDAVNRLRPDALQIVNDHGHYTVKWASADGFQPQQQQVTPVNATQLAGGGTTGAELAQNNQVTVAPQAPAQPVSPELVTDSEVRVVDQYGLWLTQDTLGNKVVGWIFPKVFDFDGKAMDSDLFTNGSQYAMQPSIAGKMIGKSTDIPSTPPKGYGCLFFVDGGTAKAFSPMTVTGTFTDPQGMANYMAETDLGEKVTFYMTDHVKNLTRVGTGQLVVPSTYKWLPLKAKTDLIAAPDVFMKTADKHAETVELIGDGNLFSYRGPAVSKLASHDSKFLNREDTMFLGAVLGVDPGMMKSAMEHASNGRVVPFSHVRTITPLKDKYAAAKRRVQDMVKSAGDIPNVFLIKEAAVLNDPLTVDKILGLGFITPENIVTFVEMLPNLEATSSQLAELLFAVRVGMSDVPEVAVERMLAALEDVIRGLRTLKQREASFGDK